MGRAAARPTAARLIASRPPAEPAALPQFATRQRRFADAFGIGAAPPAPRPLRRPLRIRSGARLRRLGLRSRSTLGGPRCALRHDLPRLLLAPRDDRRGEIG